mgnify:CR=1 FL=1
MKRLIFIFALLLCCSAVQANARGIMTMCGAGVPVAGCTTPTGDELTESFGEGSTSCWTSGSSVCDQTWVTTGTVSIEDTPASAPSNTACAKSLKFDSTSAASNGYHRLDAAIANNVAITINFTMYIDSSSVAQYSDTRVFALVNTAAMTSANSIVAFGLNKPSAGSGSATKMKAIVTDSCTIDFAEDTWYDVTLTMPASDAGDQSTLSVNGGAASCTFTKNTSASDYVYIGASGTGIVGYVGNLRITTP